MDFRDVLGRPIAIDLRVASVSRLSPEAVTVWFEDPDSADDARVYEADPDELLVANYQSARDVAEVYGRELRGSSGAESFGSAPLPQSSVSLMVHNDIMEVLDDPDGLRQVRAEWQEEFASIKRKRSRQAIGR